MTLDCFPYPGWILFQHWPLQLFGEMTAKKVELVNKHGTNQYFSAEIFQKILLKF